MNNLKVALIILGLFSVITSSMAQEIRHNSTRVAYTLTEMQGDFGLGFQIESPSFLHDAITIKLRANQMFLSYDLEGKNQWGPYWHSSVGISSNPVNISERVALYGEGGASFIIPNSDFSTSDSEWAGYGLFGFNFHFAPQFCYFLEAGASGSGAKAEKSDNQRFYANGFIVNVGFKIMFGD